MYKFRFLLCAFITTVVSQASFADVRLNRLFSDGMVVQRETEIAIWGWADPGESVSVETSWGAKGEGVASADGDWSTRIETPKAGGPFTITVSGTNEIVLDDVLSGEVWLCTGQSNMDFALSRFVGDAREVQYQPLVESIRNEVATATDPWIRHIEVPQTTSIYEAKVDFEGQWVEVKPGQTEVISATGYFFAKELRKHLDVPVGLVECSWGGSLIEPWISEDAFRSDEELESYFDAERSKAEALIAKMDAEGYVDTKYVEALKKWEANGKKGREPRATVDPRDDRQVPATLYNGMISSIIPYSVKGSIWYQGESNAKHFPEEYQKRLTAMVETWRKDWGIGDFSFYWTQLAGYNSGEERQYTWAMVGDQMRRALVLPNTGMVVLHDIGEAKDIHPHNKMDAGKRFALLALEKDYGVKLPAASGPLYGSFKVKKAGIKVRFDEVGSGLMVGRKVLMEDTVEVEENLGGFDIVGEDGEWKAANAKIVSKRKVVVSHPDIVKPKAVRYAWLDNPVGANLYNKEGLPAAVFTTEER